MKESTRKYKEQIAKWAVIAGRDRRGALRAVLQVDDGKRKLSAAVWQRVIKIIEDLQVEAKRQREGGILDMLYTRAKDKAAK